MSAVFEIRPDSFTSTLQRITVATNQLLQFSRLSGACVLNKSTRNISSISLVYFLMFGHT